MKKRFMESTDGITIICEVEVIVYANDRAWADGLYATHFLPLDLIEPLQRLNGKTFAFSFNSDATLDGLRAKIKKEMIAIKPRFRWWSTIEWALFQDKRYYIQDCKQNLKFILNKYFGYPDNKYITIQLLLSGDAGEIDEGDGLKYYVYSHESSKHNMPHVHVVTMDHDYSASIAIESGEVIAGELPKKKKRLAKKRILNKQLFFYECWNTQTDGLRVDINKELGITNY